MDENALVVKLQENEVSEETADNLKNIFTPYFVEAEKWAAQAKEIEVTSVEQSELMGKAREARLALKRIRCDVENTRKDLKAESLRKGKAIDGMANVIKYLIVPIEEHLQEQEDFVKLQEQKRKEELAAERESGLRKYVEDTAGYNLMDMSEEAFDSLIDTHRKAYEAQQEAERKAEEERKAREKAEAEEAERIRKENEQLKKEAEAREKAEAERKKKEEAARQKEEAAQKAREEKERKERGAYEAKIRKEREEKERILAEQKAKEEAAQKAKEEEEKARAEAERQKELAPDKKKLEDWAVRIAQVEVPTVKSEGAKKVVKNAIELLNKTGNYIKENITNI